MSSFQTIGHPYGRCASIQIPITCRWKQITNIYLECIWIYLPMLHMWNSYRGECYTKPYHTISSISSISSIPYRTIPSIPSIPSYLHRKHSLYSTYPFIVLMPRNLAPRNHSNNNNFMLRLGNSLINPFLGSLLFFSSQIPPGYGYESNEGPILCGV